MTRILPAVLFIIILLFSCASQKVTQAHIKNTSIPADYSNPHFILLIEKRTQGISKGRMNSYYKKTFNKYYTGKYEMASWEEIENNPKYQNKEVYRYVLRENVYSDLKTTIKKENTFSRGTEFQYDNNYTLKLYLFDRVTSQKSVIAQASTPAKVITFTAKLLDSQLTN